MSNGKKMDPIKIGSKVFLYSMGNVRYYEVTDFRISEWSEGLKCEVSVKLLTVTGYGQESKFFLDDFINAVKDAQDRKISDIMW